MPFKTYMVSSALTTEVFDEIHRRLLQSRLRTMESCARAAIFGDLAEEYPKSCCQSPEQRKLSARSVGGNKENQRSAWADVGSYRTSTENSEYRSRGIA